MNLTHAETVAAIMAHEHEGGPLVYNVLPLGGGRNNVQALRVVPGSGDYGVPEVMNDDVTEAIRLQTAGDSRSLMEITEEVAHTRNYWTAIHAE